MALSLKHQKKWQDQARYMFKTGQVQLADVCCFCLKSGCDTNHHEHYGSPNTFRRAHRRCQTIFHNKARAGKLTSAADYTSGHLIA